MLQWPIILFEKHTLFKKTTIPEDLVPFYNGQNRILISDEILKNGKL